tara:strand:- start:2136 stop:2396 length:261 start_codon:yes stop_codon:yes gene_type:complete
MATLPLGSDMVFVALFRNRVADVLVFMRRPASEQQETIHKYFSTFRSFGVNQNALYRTDFDALGGFKVTDTFSAAGGVDHVKLFSL